MNYVWRMGEERTAWTSSRPSRSWSNKKLVCLSNYSLLGSSLWLLHSPNRLIIIGVSDGDLICFLRCLWQIVLHLAYSFCIRNEAKANLRSFNRNPFREISSELCNDLQIYSSPTKSWKISPKLSPINAILLHSNFMIIATLRENRKS